MQRVIGFSAAGIRKVTDLISALHDASADALLHSPDNEQMQAIPLDDTILVFDEPPTPQAVFEGGDLADRMLTLLSSDSDDEGAWFVRPDHRIDPWD